MISSEDLSFAYPGGQSLRLPDVQLAQGQILLLQGNSGCGKSTCLALLAGLLMPSSGKLIVAQQDLRALRGAALDRWRGQHVGFLPQRLHLSESLTVQGNLTLAFFAAGLAHDEAKISGALQALGVADLAQRRPSQLSGGQAQRVALARAVMLSPQIILADEPTASLDDEAADQAVQLMVQAAERSNASLVIATHDARVKAALGRLDRVVNAVVMKKP